MQLKSFMSLHYDLKSFEHFEGILFESEKDTHMIGKISKFYSTTTESCLKCKTINDSIIYAFGECYEVQKLAVRSITM